MSNPGGAFEWDDGDDGPTKEVKLKFSEQDGEDLMEAIKSFVRDALPRVIRQTVRDGAKLIVKDLERQWPAVKVDELNAMRHFRDRLDLRWAPGLDPLRMILTASREIGDEFALKLSRSKAKKGIARRQAILVLHMRACQTAMEIITLLEHGLAGGAYARWRTIYEISVVAYMIDRFGDEIADRYLAHDAVSRREYVKNEYRYLGRRYDPKRLKGADKEVEDDYQAAVAKFGDSFATPYGWAAHNLGLKRPRFRDLEDAVDWSALSPHYKWSSYKVNAGVTGTVRTLGSIGGEQFALAGAINTGLEEPAIHTAYSLVHVTLLVSGRLTVLENQIRMESLVLLRDKVVRECRKTAKLIEQEELEIRSQE